MSCSAFAQVQFFVESANVDPGQHFSLKTTVNKFDKIVSMQFTIKWDPAVLSLDSIGGMSLSGLSQSNFGLNKADQGIVSVSWIDFSAQGKSLADGSTLFKLYFEAIGTSGSISDVDITSNPIKIEITDANSNGEDIGGIVEKGLVEIAANKPGMFFDTTTISLPGSACNMFKTKGIETLKKLTGTVSWDATKLGFDSICCMHPLISKGYFNTSFTNSGNILVNADNLTIPLNAQDQLFGVCFTAKGMAFEEVDLDLNGSLFPYDIKTLPAGTTNFKKGLVRLVLDKVNLGGADKIAEPGEIVEIPVLSKSPLLLQIIQGGFDFNPAELQYTGFKKAKLQAFNVDSLNLQSVLSGKIGFHYALTNAPLTLQNNDTLFYLKFKVLAQTGTTKLSQSDFSYNPIAVLNYSQLILLPLEIDTSTITIVSGVKLTAKDGSGIIGDTVCIAVTAEGFNNITSLSGALKYDPALLKFIYMDPIGLPLDPSLNVSLASGMVSFSWVDYPGSSGASLVDGDILFYICFKLIGPEGTKALVSMDSLNSSVTKSDYPGETFSLNMNTAELLILGASPLTVNGFITNNPCDGDNEGKIELEVSGGKQPYAFNWQDGSTSKNRDNLSDGNYTVLITDSSNPPQQISQVFILFHYGTKPFITAVPDQKILCPNDTLKIALNVDSFQLSWIGNSPGLAKFENDLAYIIQEGQYIYQVYDISTSCFNQDTFIVDPAPFMEPAYAGPDQKSCDEALITAFQTSNTFGYWNSLGTATVLDATSNSSSVIGLESGPNIFTWTISTTNCPAYDTDSLIISVPFPAIALNDTLNINQTKTINILANDLTANGDFYLVMPDSMPQGISIDQNGLLQFKGSKEDMPMIIQYNLCSTECPLLCSSAQISLTADTSIIVTPVNTLMPNAISPNNDGINDQLVFPQLEIDIYQNAKFIVFDRQGRLLYKDYHYKNNWNGIDDNGKDLPVDTYYYALWLSLTQGEIIKGAITILR